MDGEPEFPNVSYTEDNREVHFLKSKPLATHFVINNTYPNEARYFLEIQNDITNLLGREIKSLDEINFDTGLLNNTIDVSNYPWYQYLTTITIDRHNGLENITGINFRYGVEMEFDTGNNNGAWMNINPENDDFGIYRYIPL
jgi:hypothetical protein